MSDMSDEFIQKLLEEKPFATIEESPSVSTRDIQLYQLLFEELKKEPNVDVPPDLTMKLVAALKARKARTNAFIFYSLLVLCSGITFTGSYLFLAAMDDSFALLFLSTLIAFKWEILFSLFLFLFIMKLDQNIITQRSSKLFLAQNSKVKVKDENA